MVRGRMVTPTNGANSTATIHDASTATVTNVPVSMGNAVDV